MFVTFVRDWGYIILWGRYGDVRHEPIAGKEWRLSGTIGSWRLRGTATRYFGVLCYCDRTGAVSEAGRLRMS